MINPNNEVETILEGTEKNSKTVKVTKGKYRFRSVGAKAEGKLRIFINGNSDVEITKDKEK